MKVLRFTDYKKKTAIDELSKIIWAAKEARIDQHMFMGFGVMLGYLMFGDFIPEDDDMDVCFDADQITAEQELAYYTNLHLAGVYPGYRRRRAVRYDNDGFDIGMLGKRQKEVGEKIRFLWLSMRHRIDGVKCCNWFMFRHNGFMWHSKGRHWVKNRKFDQKVWDYETKDASIMKGIPENLLDRFEEVSFHGLKIRVPYKIGSCADYWYPGWWPHKSGGASKKKVICIVKNWLDKNTWKVAVK